MLLRIIELAVHQADEPALKIVLESDNEPDPKQQNIHFETDYYSSPFSANFHQTLSWYFAQYPLQIKSQDDQGVVQKTIRSGQAMGQQWLGEDDQLLKICQMIEAAGFANLTVQIESTDPLFFAEFWETVVLPEAKYLLATVVKGFVRKIGEPQVMMLPPLEYQLQVKAVVNDQVAQLLQAQGQAPEQAQTIEQDKPLQVLYVVARPKQTSLTFDGSNALNLALDAHRKGGAIAYEVVYNIGWDALQARLADTERPVHVIHYDGPLFVEQQQVLFSFGQSNQVTEVAALAEVMVANQVALLSVDARQVVTEGEPQAINPVLANLASRAHECGLGNVIGLSHLTNPWTASACFDPVYRKIAAGFSVAQAVVEARKALQTVITSDLLTPKPIDFHIWSLLTHYSRQDVQFFAAGVAESEEDAPNFLNVINQKLHGFQAKLLPPLLFRTGDGQALPLLQQLQLDKAVLLRGAQGSGKSATAHIGALYLTLSQSLDHAFCFDFSEDFLAVSEMLQMIAPLVALQPDQFEQVMDALVELRCCVVFDELLHSKHQNHPQLPEVLAFIAQLQQQGHRLILTGAVDAELPESTAVTIDIQPLSGLEQQMLSAHHLRLQSSETDVDLSQWHQLLAILKGNPWLTAKVSEQLSAQDCGQLMDEVATHLGQFVNGSASVDICQQYYRWQWSQLQPVWQQLLLLCSDEKGLMLEMLMAAADKTERFAPAATLFTELAAPEAKFSEGLKLWQLAGFLTRYPHGHMVDSRCKRWLKSLDPELPAQLAGNKVLQLAFSQVLTQGLTILSQHLLKQPNYNLSNNLLFNRRTWVKHFEALWFNGDYRGFFMVKNSFDQMLAQAQIQDESKHWSLDLLSRSEAPDLDGVTAVDNAVAWLSLAAAAIALEKPQQYTIFNETAERCRAWLDKLPTELTDQQKPLFQQVVNFLQNRYQAQQQWSDAIVVAQKALDIYRANQAWQRVIQMLRSLASYHGKLSDNAAALEYERQILEDIPYDGAPPEFKTQQMVEIMLDRLTRGDHQGAQTQLYEIKASATGQQMTQMLDNVQCEIYYQQGQYEAAFPYLCQQWAMAMQANQPQQQQLLQERMAQVKQTIGEEKFDALWQQLLPEEMIKP